MGRGAMEHEPWAWEAKEFIRHHLIGKKVKVEMEFKREIEIKNGPNAGQKRLMEFATIKVNGKNVSVQLIQKGFAKTNLSKFSEENSKYFEDLMEAEKKANEKKLGVHSKKPANQYKFVDTTQNKNASKTIERALKQSGKLDAVVEYVFSGGRFKLRIDSENVMIAFAIQGMRVPQPDKNSKEVSSISTLAKDYSKAQLHQRDVQIEIRHVDRKGNFFGQLWKQSGLYGEVLLQKGFAYIDA